MARRRRITRREVIADPKFNNLVVAKFVNNLMWDGKKSTAETIFYSALTQATKMVSGSSELEVLAKLMENVRPILEVRSRRVGGATYQIPVEVPQHRQDALAMRWPIGFARGRKGTPMAKALAQEFADAFNNQGNAIKKREDTHKMAEANRAFATIAGKLLLPRRAWARGSYTSTMAPHSCTCAATAQGCINHTDKPFRVTAQCMINHSTGESA